MIGGRCSVWSLNRYGCPRSLCPVICDWRLGAVGSLNMLRLGEDFCIKMIMFCFQRQRGEIFWHCEYFPQFFEINKMYSITSGLCKKLYLADENVAPIDPPDNICKNGSVYSNDWLSSQSSVWNLGIKFINLLSQYY